MIQFQDPEYFLHKQNTEFYAHQKAHESLFFLNLFPLHQNETGTFISVTEELSAAKDIADKVMSEPANYAEGIEFTDIEFSDAEITAGTLGGKGFGFKYSDMWENNGMMSSTYPNRVGKCISALCIYTDKIIAETVKNSAGVTGPTFSDWSDSTAINAGQDIINVHSTFSELGLGYKPSDVLLSHDKYYNLCSYLKSLKVDFDMNAVKWDGINYWNLENQISSNEYIALSNTVNPVILEKYTNPKYSTIQQAIETARENGNSKALVELPQGLVNMHQYKPEGHPEINRDIFWFNMMPNVQERYAIMKGAFE